MAERTVIDTRRSVVLPDDTDPVAVAAAMNPAMASWVALRQRVRFQAGQSVLVLGAGNAGQIAVQVAKLLGASRIVVAGRLHTGVAGRLRAAGAAETVSLDGELDVAAKRIGEVASDVDVVLDLTPMAQQPILDAINAVRWGGTIVLAGLKGHQDIPIPTDLLINKALTVKGAFSVDAAAYTDAIKLIESGKFPLEKMQTHKYGLDNVEHAIKLLAGEVPGEDGIHVAVMPGL